MPKKQVTFSDKHASQSPMSMGAPPDMDKIKHDRDILKEKYKKTKDTMDTLRHEICTLQRMIEEKDWIIEMQMQTKEISETKANQLIAEVGKLREELRIIKYKNVPLRA